MNCQRCGVSDLKRNLGELHYTITIRKRGVRIVEHRVTLCGCCAQPIADQFAQLVEARYPAGDESEGK